MTVHASATSTALVRKTFTMGHIERVIDADNVEGCVAALSKLLRNWCTFGYGAPPSAAGKYRGDFDQPLEEHARAIHEVYDADKAKSDLIGFAALQLPDLAALVAGGPHAFELPPLSLSNPAAKGSVSSRGTIKGALALKVYQ